MVQFEKLVLTCLVVMLHLCECCEAQNLTAEEGDDNTTHFDELTAQVHPKVLL